MPLPKPQDAERQESFVRRWHESDELAKQFPDEATRRNILEQIHEQAKTVCERKTVIVPFSEVKELEDTPGVFEGYGSTFGNIDLGNDRIIEGAFTDTLKAFKGADQLPAMFWMHDWTDPVGDWMAMDEDAKGLAVKGALWVEGNKQGQTPIERAAQVRNQLRGTGPKGLSIGFAAREFDFEADDDNRLIRNLKKVDLFEVSPVPFGMNPEALVTGAKGLQGFVGALPTIRELEKILRDGGCSHRQAKAICAEGFAGIDRDGDHGLLKALQGLNEQIVA